jgi:hypothetical protein
MKDKYNQILCRIDQLENSFRENKAIILSEDDLKCLVFHLVYDLFLHNVPTFNADIKGSPLHTELKFFNSEGKLFFRPDITILNPENYSIRHSIADFRIKEDKVIYEPTSSKEFEFGGDLIIIELKFCRSKLGIKDIKSFQNDIEKMHKIKELVERGNTSKVLGLLAIFNKTDKRTHNFNDFIASFSANSDIKAKYYSGMLDI